jgi:hypothetical protein
MKNLRFGVALMLGLAISEVASAGTITFGTAPAGQAFPFMVDYVGEYQQVYNGALFSGPVSITQITFFGGPRSPGTISGDYTLRLSTTSAAPSTLSTIYADNIGLDNAVFFSGAVSNTLSFSGMPFVFDPADGNLLLDVLVNTSNDVPVTNPVGFLASGCSTDTNRVFNLSGNGPSAIGLGSDPTLCSSYGLQTQFTFTSAQVPEPSELAVFGTGLLALMGFGVRRQRSRV